MDSQDYQAALAALAWQVDLGADEAIGDAPVDRYALEATKPKPAPQDSPHLVTEDVDPVAFARAAAGSAATLDDLKAALGAYEHCELKKGARNLVFADGLPKARVMIVGEAPGRDEDREGRPFVGRAGQLLDRMLAAIDMGRADAEAPVYI
ncbi:MAG: uracil-DNA glycosylase, partial [Pseudomonadota bacterium]